MRNSASSDRETMGVGAQYYRTRVEIERMDFQDTGIALDGESG